MTTQIRIAHRLASAHGHEWAFMGEDVAAAAFAVGGVKLIADLTDAARGDSAFCGIAAPHIEDGVVHHTTGSGRLRWEVYEDGHVALWISRPTGDVLGASLAPDGRLIDAFACEGAVFGPRHLDTLAAAVLAAVDGHWLIRLEQAEVARLQSFGLELVELDGPCARPNQLAAAQVRAALQGLIDPAEAAREAAIMASYAAADAEWAATQDALALEDDAEPTGPVVQVRRRPVEPVGEVEA